MNENNPTKEWVEKANQQMAEDIVAYLVDALSSFGIPKGTWTTDQIDNMLAMHNLRGITISTQVDEIAALRERIDGMEGVLVDIANWPNREKSEQIAAIKLLATCMVDPRRVDSMKSLTTS